MRRSMGRVIINFGLVSIPTKLYSSVDASTRVSFNLMSPKGERLKQQYIDPAGNVVEHSKMLKGYAYEKDRYVTFTQDEIRALQEQSSPAISIASFAPDAIPPAYVEKTYYLAPEGGAEKAYELLRTAMLASNKVGVTKHCSHGKQHLAIIRAAETGLMLQHLHYSNEVIDFKEVYQPSNVKVQPAELKMAQMLIESTSVDAVDLSEQRDEVKDRLEAAIAAKVAGKEIDPPKEEEEPSATQDLLAALERSLAA